MLRVRISRVEYTYFRFVKFLALIFSPFDVKRHYDGRIRRVFILEFDQL